MKYITLSIILLSLVVSCRSVKESKMKELKVLENPQTQGCGNFEVVQKIESINEMGTFAIIKIDKNKIELTDKFSSFDVKNNPLIDGRIDVLNKKEGNNYCTDAIIPFLEVTQTFKLIEGTIKIRIVKQHKEMERFGNTPYSVEVILENAVFTNKEKTYKVSKIHYNNVLVHYIMG